MRGAGVGRVERVEARTGWGNDSGKDKDNIFGGEGLAAVWLCARPGRHVVLHGRAMRGDSALKRTASRRDWMLDATSSRAR